MDNPGLPEEDPMWVTVADTTERIMKTQRTKSTPFRLGTAGSGIISFAAFQLGYRTRNGVIWFELHNLNALKTNLKVTSTQFHKMVKFGVDCGSSGSSGSSISRLVHCGFSFKQSAGPVFPSRITA